MFNIFSNDISLKVNVIVQLEFKLTYFKAAVQHFSHYTMKTPQKMLSIKKKIPHFLNEIDDLGSNPGGGCVSLHVNALKERDKSLSSPAIDKKKNKADLLGKPV